MASAGSDFKTEDLDSVLNVIGLSPNDPLDSFGEMWYQVFLWTLFSSMFVHIIACLISLCQLRKHTVGRWIPLGVFAMGVISPLTGGVMSSAAVAALYRASGFVMMPFYALVWGVGQTIIVCFVSFTRILATLSSLNVVQDYTQRDTTLNSIYQQFPGEGKEVPGFKHCFPEKYITKGSMTCLFRRFHNNLRIIKTQIMATRPSSDMAGFREEFSKAKHIVILTGAGVSAESGVPTFRGAGGYWRKWQAQQLASPEAFADNPSLVWEFYHYRREVMASKHPNPAHIAIAECEKRLKSQDRRVVIVTQNIDGLHKRAGSENIIELHGNLFKTRCLKCGEIAVNTDSPICEALRGKGAPDPDAPDSKIPEDQLPRCKKADCSGLLRPHVVWFGEQLDPKVLEKSKSELDKCDLCLVVGTSSVVYPAAMFAPKVANRGVTVAEFNVEYTVSTGVFKYHFQGPAGENVPTALTKHDTE